MIFIVCAVAALTIYNLRGNLSVLSTLPDHRLHHIDAAREEAKEIPFHEREHRLERRPRLERPGGTGALPACWVSFCDELLCNDGYLQLIVVCDIYAEVVGHFKIIRDAVKKPEHKSKVASAEQASSTAPLDKYHVVASVDGGLYTEWQIRICHYHYKKVLRNYPDSPMGGFTRLLHRQCPS